MKKLFILLFLTFFISSCKVGPDYQSVRNTSIPKHWEATLPHHGSNMQMIQWWGTFNDPLLQELIETSLKYNPSIFEAVAQIKQAQANLNGGVSALYPTLTGTASSTTSNGTVLNVSSDSGSDVDTTENNINTTTVNTTRSAGLNSAWEIDLFGANRRTIEVYQARLSASQADWNDAKVALAADVANAYVSYRECEYLEDIYQNEAKSRKKTQEITILRVKSGFSPSSDGAQAKGSFYQNNSTLAYQQGVCLQYQNELSTLTGIPLPSLKKKLALTAKKIPLPKETTIDAIPAKIISQRPDVSSAEKSVMAANAQIGVAVANRYPSLSLTGTLTANSGASVTQASSWSFGPAISVPLFNGGYLKAQEALARAQYDEALAVYKQTVITAVKEVENALVTIQASNNQVLEARNAENNYQMYFDAMNKKYQHGWLNLLDLETSRMVLLSSKETLAAAQLNQVQAWIALYEAVGGSWIENTLITQNGVI